MIAGALRRRAGSLRLQGVAGVVGRGTRPR